MKKTLCVLVVLVVLTSIQQASALVIIRDFVGGTPPTNSHGSGNLNEIFNRACDVWTNVLREDFTLTLHFGYKTNGSGSHVLLTQGGIPNREIEGEIFFNNNNNVNNMRFYLDSTPLNNEEYSSYVEESAELGAGLINISRSYSGGPTGPTGQCIDLFSVALHEIGHALGMSYGNSSFVTEAADGNVNVTLPRPYAGSTIPLNGNNGALNHIAYLSASARTVMSGSFAPGERSIPSAVDIIALAQLSGFTNVHLTLAPTLEIGKSFWVTNTFKKGNKVSTAITKMVPLTWSGMGTYIVQQSTNLKVNNWSTVSTNVSSTGEYVTHVSMTNSSCFFRLMKL